MAQMLEALLALQKIETRLAHLKGRLKARQRASTIQKNKVDQLNTRLGELHDLYLQKRSTADSAALALQEQEEEVAKLRRTLNTVRTNKEYAAILTQINTYRADNASVEERALQTMQEADEIKAQSEELKVEIETEQAKFAEVTDANAEEIAKLEGMLAEVQAERDAATGGIAPETLAAFDRLVDNYDGEAMAPIEEQGSGSRANYICGGCYMTLNAEHVNALQKYDQIRNCDNCGRILYLEAVGETSDD
jgi:predicted  nucleic acid-binding Zn-ribbon protein